MAEQNKAFLTESDHALLIDIFYEPIGNSKDPVEVQSIESLMRRYERSGDGAEMADEDVRQTISLVCRYYQMLSEQKHANDDLLDFYADSLNKLQARYEQAIQDHRHLEEDQIKIYQDYDKLMQEHLRLYRQYEKIRTKTLRWLRLLKKL